MAVLSAGIFSCAHSPKDNPYSGKQINSETGNFWITGFSSESGLRYVATFPKEYADDNLKEWPLIVFLHSLAERGEDAQLLIENPSGQGIGIAKVALEEYNFPFVTISPLCPKGSFWPLLNRKLNDLLSDFTETYTIDAKRIYLTGVSMGGMGTWSFASKYPRWFAAIAPISGGFYKPLMRERVDVLKTVPVWAFHDRYDAEIPLLKEEKTVEKIKQAGGDITYTITETGEHYLQNRVFAEGQVFKWFLSHIKQ